VQEVTILGFDSEGRPSDALTPDALFAADGDGNPYPSSFEPIEPGKVVWHGPEPGELCDLWAFWPVEGFGRVWLPAAGPWRDGQEVVLSEVLAATRRGEVLEILVDRKTNAWPAPQEMKDELRDSYGALQRATKWRGAGRAKRTDPVLSRLMHIGEQAVLDRAELRIEHLPKQDFHMGANFFGYPDAGEEYTERFAAALDFATLPFYLKGFEPERGKPQYEACEKAAEFCRERGMTPKGHPLIWFYKDTTPDWLRELHEQDGYGALLEHCHDRVYDCVSHYKGLIDTWDIINEAHGWANCLRLTLEQLVEITKVGCQAAREANPDAITIVNNCCLDGVYVARGNDHEGPTEAERLCTPLQYMKMVQEAGVDYDVLGLQLYYPSRDLLQIEHIFDRYARFGKPIHITEVAVPSACHEDEQSFWRGEDAIPNMGVWHRPWDEELQAEWARAFYTICRGHPSVEAVIWWDFADGRGGHFFPHGGFLRPDLSPKPSYDVLLELSGKWLDR
jgi:endo-1,4-beta-xylanase